MRGRKPKPERLRVLEAKRVRDVGGSATPPPRPAWLTPEAAEEWDRVVDLLAELELANPLDVTTLAAYCETYAQWRRAVLLVREQGLTSATKDGVKANPNVKTCAALVCELRRMAAEFGFSPAARSRIDMSRAEGEEEDELETFLGDTGS